MTKFDKGFLAGVINATILKYIIRIALMMGYIYVFGKLGLYTNDLIVKIMATLTAAGMANFIMREYLGGYFVDPYDDVNRITKLIEK